MKKILAIILTCCALVLAMGLVACGGGSGSGSSSAASSSDDSAAKQAAEAQDALDEGVGYWLGTGANGFDKEKARADFQKAADLGNAEGWYWLGVLAQHDTSADRWPQVIDYYQKAADNDCAKGYVGLGSLYETGYGVEKDAAKAQELFQKAIDADELLGYTGLGGLYKDGHGVEASGTKAAELYEKALASDDFVTRNKARCNLGKLYSQGAEGLEADGAKAEEYFQKAADENYHGGWRGLGYMYSQGMNVEADLDKAFKYYSKEADLGELHNLATMYQKGAGCEQDPDKAFALFADESNGREMAAWAMGGLAFCACTGQGTDVNLDVATDWCNKALAAAGPGDQEAVDYANYLLDWIAQGA